jgi:anti-sigma factor RsiW
MNDTPLNSSDLTPAESAVLMLDEAESLIWALLDDQIEATETTRLTQLLNEHEEVRRRYLECVQLHVDLQDHFSARETVAARTPILPNLLPGGVTNSEARIVD